MGPDPEFSEGLAHETRESNLFTHQVVSGVKEAKETSGDGSTAGREENGTSCTFQLRQ